MKWIRPSGSPIETNDNKETIKYCKSLGWTPEGEKAPKKKPAKKSKD